MESSVEQSGDVGRRRHRRQVGRRHPAPLVPPHQTLVHEHAGELLDQERVPAGRRRDAVLSLLGERGAPDEGLKQLGHAVRIEGLQRQRRDVVRVGAPVQGVGASRREQEDRSAHPRGHRADETGERGIGGVGIVDRHDHGTIPGDAFQQTAHRPRRLLGNGGAVGEREHVREPFPQHRSIRLAVDQAVQRRRDVGQGIAELHAERLLDQSCERPGRLALCGVAASNTERGGVVRGLRPGDQGLREPRFPDTGASHDGDRDTGALGHGSLEQLSQRDPLRVPAHDRGAHRRCLSGVRAHDRDEEERAVLVLRRRSVRRLVPGSVVLGIVVHVRVVGGVRLGPLVVARRVSVVPEGLLERRDRVEVVMVRRCGGAGIVGVRRRGGAGVDWLRTAFGNAVVRLRDLDGGGSGSPVCLRTEQHAARRRTLREVERGIR